MSGEISLADAISNYGVPIAGTPPPATMEDLMEEIRALKERIDALEKERDTAVENITILFGLIKKLRDIMSPEPQPLQASRGEILRALLAQNNGKMLESEARKKMGMPKNLFSELLRTLDEYIMTKPYHLDRRRNILILK